MGTVSDETSEILHRQLWAKGYGDLRQVRVRRQNSTVVLRGDVRSYHMKQVAQEVVRGHCVGLQIRNEIRVH